ncbi:MULTISPECIES: class I SAM-dependent methyltransferase [unclassified Streptomyces]|uniref:class I SAM-dependent methyltransferase n=1 Tax=unclassified Streptomyces TaxID=2593676 RepID=UPI000DADFACB|nr:MULTISPECIES: class I SAM-dependent methyltransferase [unclassified Streptomyces]PZT74954.1 class I SAM-dependent methyltransferase [Streptomyces sp. AC1-42T]PZT82062.1 class I SAM-dependent methyltransferase [Streptomyces sp. AC1-42W]
MTSAAVHYDQLLAAQYTWMLGGDIGGLAAEQKALLRRLGVRPGPDGGLAVDLGCGPGQQSLALARIGFASVVAVDTSKDLLDELALHARGEGATGISPVHGDLRGALRRVARPGTVDAVVCMGDTLPHLPDKADVTRLLADVADALAPGGRFVATYRDLSRRLEGTDRFIPVRSDEDRVLTCFLEYVAHDTVMVHDLLHTRSGHTWTQQVGSYPKLRIAADWLTEQCRAAGLEVHDDTEGPRGMRLVHAVKSRGGERCPE